MSAASTARRQKNERAFKRERRKLRSIKGIWPARNEDYRRWIATQPCTLAPHCRIPVDSHPVNFVIECAHTGPHGISQKASDEKVIPLHHWCHQEAKDAQGKSRNWFQDHGLDRDQVIAELRTRYERETR